jgi:hypothetical protein
VAPSEAIKTNSWMLNTNIVIKNFYGAPITPKMGKTIPLNMGSSYNTLLLTAFLTNFALLNMNIASKNLYSAPFAPKVDRTTPK